MPTMDTESRERNTDSPASQAPTISSMGDHRLDQAVARLQSLLVGGESLRHVAAQIRFGAIVKRRVLVAATTGRVIIFRRGLFGGFRMTDIRWQDLAGAQLRENWTIFGADLILQTRNQDYFVLPKLRSEQARPLYVFCQEQEQVWREKNRIRRIEEDRAKAGGVFMGAGGVAPGGSTANAPSDPTERLKRAKAMLDQGLLSDAEYEAIKAKIISEM